jgi:hypothetical protein
MAGLYCVQSQETRMLEDSLDPRPSLDQSIAMLLDPEDCQAAALLAVQVAGFWDDRRSEWANLRDLRYWLEQGC